MKYGSVTERGYLEGIRKPKNFSRKMWRWCAKVLKGGAKCRILPWSPKDVLGTLRSAKVMFLGEYEHSLDAKQRLAIPAEIRDA